MGPDYETLEEICSIYQKSAYEKGLIIKELEEENKKLKEKVSEVNMVADDEKQSIEHILELEKENKKLKEKIRFLEQCLDNKEKVNKSLREDIKWYEKEEDRLEEENRKLKEENDKLKEERDFFKEQAMLWRKDYTNEYEKNRNLIGKLESLEK